MKKEHVILLIAGVAVALFVLSRRQKQLLNQKVIKPGDKSNEVYGLQSTITAITGLQFPNMGAYDNDTLNAVKYYMEGTNALVDQEKGYVCSKFASDLYLMQSKIKKS